MIYIVVIVVFLFIWTLASAIFFTLFYKEKSIEKLKYFDEDYEIKEKIESHKKSKNNILKEISNFIPNTKLSEKSGKKLEIELMRADMPITVEELLVIKILSAVALGFLTFAVTKSIIFFLIIFVLVWNLPKFIIANKKKKRIKLFDSQLNEGIMIISNSLKAGYSFMQAIAAVTEETKDPFSKEFKKMLKEMSLGISEEEALRNLINRIPSGDLRLIVNAILIQKDIGGNLSEILENIAETIRERQKIQSELKTLTAQGRLSGIIVMLIPIVLGGTIYLFNKEYILLLFNNPLGLIMVFVAGFSQLLGFIMIKKIISIDM
jgi:tight adherence protein B